FSCTLTAPTELYTLSLHDALPISRIPQTGLEASRRNALSFAIGLVLLMVLCDWGENICQAILVHNHGISGGASLLGSIFWALKRSEEHTSELQSRGHLVCRLLLEK